MANTSMSVPISAMMRGRRHPVHAGDLHQELVLGAERLELGLDPGVKGRRGRDAIAFRRAAAWRAESAGARACAPPARPRAPRACAASAPAPGRPSRKLGRARGKRLQHRHAGDAEDVAGHAGQLDAGALQQLQHPVALRRPRLDQRPPGAHQLAQVADRRRRHEALADQPVADQLRNPLRIFHVGLAARHVLDVVGVADGQVEVALQHGVDRLPVDAGALHADVGDAVLGEPRPQGFQLVRRGAEGAEQLLRPAPWRADRTQQTTLAWCTSRPAQRSRRASIAITCHEGGAAIAAPQAKSDTAARARRDRRRQRMMPGNGADRSAGRGHVTQNPSASKRSPASRSGPLLPVAQR